MLGFLEEVVREVPFDACEVVLECRRVKVRRDGCVLPLSQEIKLRLMHLKTIDLAMMERMRAYDAVRRIEPSCVGTQASVGRQPSVFGKPGADGPLRDVAVKSSAEDGLRIRERVTEVERGDGLEHEFEGIGFVLPWRAGEAVQALAAAKNLQRLETVSAFALFGSILAAAFGQAGFGCTAGVEVDTVGRTLQSGDSRGQARRCPLISVNRMRLGMSNLGRESCVAGSHVSHEVWVSDFADCFCGEVAS